MHERYMFPAMALILAFCATNSLKKNYKLYAFVSAVHFINVYQIYSHYYASVNSEYDCCVSFYSNEVQSQIVIYSIYARLLCGLLFLHMVIKRSEIFSGCFCDLYCRRANDIKEQILG